jgi:hypothetical protein
MKRKDPLGRPRHRWEENVCIRTYIKEIGHKILERFLVAQV